MTGDELKTLAESIEDGQVFDDDLFYSLLEIAKTNLESERFWQYLLALDDSNVAPSGNSSVGISLPADFAEDYKLLVGTDAEYFPVRFEEQHLYRNASRRYYLDLANEQYFLLGNVKSDTIYFYYKKFTPAITENTSPLFPVRFHPILAFMVVGYHQTGVDSDDLFARMGPVNRAEALAIKNSMISWDTNLAMRAQNDTVGMHGSSLSNADADGFPLGLM